MRSHPGCQTFSFLLFLIFSTAPMQKHASWGLSGKWHRGPKSTSGRPLVTLMTNARQAGQEKCSLDPSNLKREIKGSRRQGLSFQSLLAREVAVRCLHNLSAEHLTASHKYLRFNHCYTLQHTLSTSWNRTVGRLMFCLYLNPRAICELK